MLYRGVYYLHMPNEIISVIIPTYNREDTIVESVKSVLNQTYKNLELIIVDDASTDNTLKVLSDIKDDRLSIYPQTVNQGANYCRNYGISKAKGRYVSFNDSDDIWHRKKLEVCLNMLVNKNADVVFSSFFRIYKGKKEIYPKYNLNSYENKYRTLLLNGNCVSTQTLLMKRECMLDTPFDDDMPKLQDWDLAIRLAKKYKLYFIEEPLVDTFLQKNSLSFKQKDFEATSMLLKKHEFYINNDKELKINFLKGLAYTQEMLGKSAYRYYYKIYSESRTKKNLIRFILSVLHISPIIVKTKSYIRRVKLLK